MLPKILPRSLLYLLAASLTNAERVADDLSFGHAGNLAPHGGGSIPNWQGSSSKHSLQILSDRAILTPPYPGNTKGALWSEKTVNSNYWFAEIEFRASGQETGSGNLNIFYAKDKNPLLLETAYTAGRFDGLVIVIDQYASSGGKIRGFLNDGSTDFRAQSNLESLAFGHCDYPYRNLGRPSRLKIISQDGLRVEIDGRECFASDRISLPSGYYLGVTASTNDQPDSFEVYKFVTTADIGHDFQHSGPAGTQQQQQQQQQEQVPQLQKLNRFPRSPEAMPDRSAEDIRSQQDQFADLHNRLQAMSHQIAEVFGELEILAQNVEQNHWDIMGRDGTGVNIGLNAKIDGLHRRIENIERISEYTRKNSENVERIVEYTRKGYENVEQIVEYTRKQLDGGNFHEHYSRLHESIDAITRSTPRMGFFLFVVVGVQVLLAGSYVVYKRRRNSMPKKYL